ncbi:ANTAR domain-containing protein [Streptomyces venezuelae]
MREAETDGAGLFDDPVVRPDGLVVRVDGPAVRPLLRRPRWKRQRCDGRTRSCGRLWSAGRCSIRRGVLMAAGGCSAEEAWEVMVEISQRSNTKLRQVAEMVVASTSGDHLPDSVALQLPALRRFVIGRAAER